MGRYGTLDYPTLTKRGLLLGLGLFVVGVGGAMIGNAYFESIPAWEQTLFFDLAVGGLLVGFLSPLIFGVVLPLTE